MVSAAEATDALSFAKATAGKYATEFPNSRLFAETFTVRFRPEPSMAWSGARYNRLTGVVTVEITRTFSNLSMQPIVRRCKTTGRHVGVNAFGVKKLVAEQTCETLFLRGPAGEELLGLTYRDIFGLKFRGTPNDARRVDESLFDIEVDFRPDVPDDGDFITVINKDVSEATLSDPYEVHGMRYTMYARVLGIRYFLHGAKRPFVARSDEDTEGFAPEP